MEDRGGPRIDLGGQDFGQRYVERRSYGFPITIIVLMILSGLIFGGYYFYTTSEIFGAYKTFYAKLGVDLPRTFETTRDNGRNLARLQREPCDIDALSRVSADMERESYNREAATILESFHRNCTSSPELMQRAFEIFTRIGDHKSALRIADELVQSDPGDYDYRFMRGNAYERSKDYKLALTDYISTLELFTDLRKVDGSQFYQVSLMYDKLGRPCDAIGPLETYLSYNVAERQTAQITKLISEYSKKGNCAATYATGSARLIIPPSNVVDVLINGARARMIIDTGASSVVVTPEMAARARINPDKSDLVDVKVAGGLMKQATGYAQSIKIADATASNVPILIAVNSKDAFGAQVDGLLGMSFLSRFVATLSPGLFELKPRTRN